MRDGTIVADIIIYRYLIKYFNEFDIISLIIKPQGIDVSRFKNNLSSVKINLIFFVSIE